MRCASDVVLLARALRESADAVDERVEVRGTTALDVDVDAGGMCQPAPRSQHDQANVPVENGATKGTSAAGPAEEQVPDGVTEGGGLRGRAEARRAGRTAKRQSDNLALGLARLDRRSEELAIREFSACEVRIVGGVAGLLIR